jgi:hypothetical protein
LKAVAMPVRPSSVSWVRVGWTSMVSSMPKGQWK